MSYDSLVNRGDYFSAHYLAEVLPKALKGKDGPFRRWTELEKEAEQEKRARRAAGKPETSAESAEAEGAAATGETTDSTKPTPRAGLRALKSRYFKDRPTFAEATADIREGGGFRPKEAAAYRERLHALHRNVLSALGYSVKPEPVELTVEDGDEQRSVRVALQEPTLAAIECGWAPDVDAAMDEAEAGRLLDPAEVGEREPITLGTKLASWLFNQDERLRYVLILAGGVIVLADRTVWGEGRYLAVSLDVALGRGDTDELGTIAALFGAEALLPPEEGGAEPIQALLDASRQHAVGVSKDLREGLQKSVEIIANEVLERLREQKVRPDQLVDSNKEFADELARESLRYLYRILFLLYAEARPELGVVPADDEAYMRGYSMARLGDLVVHGLVGEESRNSVHLYESLDLLFRMVNEGHRPRGRVLSDEEARDTSEGDGLRFEALKADLFDPERTRLIGRSLIHPDDDQDDPVMPRLDTRLRNKALHRVLRLLMLARGKRKERGGFISYAQLGINQLGAVYEGLMSYTGFIAEEMLYEAAKNGDPKDGSWLVPHSAVEDYPNSVWVPEKDEDGFPTGERVVYKPGSFVYRLAGRDRETSASYYTPESLTQLTVQLALRELLDKDGKTTKARELLDWTICEPALGSGAFLNEAINQVAAEYLKRRQDELGVRLEPEDYTNELQKVKAYIALHRCYGVDLNVTAVELAEVSLWLNVMHPGLQAPWFGLHLRRGNSLIGAGRRLYSPDQLAKGAWLKEAPDDCPLREGEIPEGHIHHFLLPAQGWGCVAAEKEAKAFAPEDAKRLATWRKEIRKAPSATKKRGEKQSQVQRLQGLARRAEYLWGLVIRRLEISEREISRHIDVWGAEDLEHPKTAVPREKVLNDLTAHGTPYWRLKTLMDAWCALWFWPVQNSGLLDGSDAVYQRLDDTLDISRPGTNGSLFGTPSKSIPLANLDNWLEFAEALLGRADVPKGSLVDHFATLDDLSEYEDQLPTWTGMESEFKLAERFPWVHTIEEIADQHGYLHWELQFAHIFQPGGFTLQTGNPPWVRPQWDEDAVLSELDPWFKLHERVDTATVANRKASILQQEGVFYFLTNLAETSGMSSFLADKTTYPLISGTQPDLYRAFMCRTWNNISDRGAVGLVHPDTHFGGKREGELRAQTYRRLRFHAHFVNAGNWAFPSPVGRSREFGVHIYSFPSSIDFTTMNWLYNASVVMGSLEHDGHGAAPGIRHEGRWDLRAHKDRLVHVNYEQLAEWRRLTGSSDQPVEHAPLLHPVTASETSAMRTLARYSNRLGLNNPHISFGFHEANSKKLGLIQWENSSTNSLKEVVLQGPHISPANPFAQNPSIPFTHAKDWHPCDPTKLDENATPDTNYKRTFTKKELPSLQETQEVYNYTEYYRVAWRGMIAFDIERSLFAALIPPGPSHVDAVHSLALDTWEKTALTAGFWASLPLDYLLRITGRSHLRIAEANMMPAPIPGHPLSSDLILRTLRLNCLTNAYAPLWSKLFEPTWQDATWACDWPRLEPLGEIDSHWRYSTPLRSEHARRACLVEIDALVAAWLGLTFEQLIAIYKARFQILAERDENIWFDANCRKIAADRYAYGFDQTKEHYLQLHKHLDSPDTEPVPEGYSAPFYKADRENEYRQAHAYFTEKLERAKANGEWDGEV
ncbi:class I SAM-dependent DNA methyltransferase [Nocardiopsis gilva YIM 90087]|uniref:site-specific DNA-methyltransferase (adenine-specific) n=1 Tax=Nocardiopsis gilva YIM 90087 TaxID=1235441 RepID=A0A223S470_9ACTN|nr:class I SAM-dependent DNA methyltransferase [Nocardiopsis gilva]ASU82936.1 class I SAM-dependent DNA methyltransferase [Nocardiopsis gilva YIM 90087]